jgi:hypothetical protein
VLDDHSRLASLCGRGWGSGNCDRAASECVWLLPLQGMPLPTDLSWKGVEEWLRRRGAGGEMLLLFENTEDVLQHDTCTEVRISSVCGDVERGCTLLFVRGTVVVVVKHPEMPLLTVFLLYQNEARFLETLPTPRPLVCGSDASVCGRTCFYRCLWLGADNRS